MGQCLSLLYWAVTKLLFPLPLEIMNNPLYISTGNVHNWIRCAHGEAISLLGFLSIPKSKSLRLYYIIFLTSRITFSGQRVWIWSRISYVLKTPLSYFFRSHLPCYAPSNVKASNSEMCWWTLLQSNIWIWSLSCRLSWTSFVGLHCSRVVSKVGDKILILKYDDPTVI